MKMTKTEVSRWNLRAKGCVIDYGKLMFQKGYASEQHLLAAEQSIKKIRELMQEFTKRDRDSMRQLVQIAQKDLGEFSDSLNGYEKCLEYLTLALQVDEKKD